MPEIVKYERIQTAEQDDEDIAFPSPTANGVQLRRQSTSGIESQIEIPATRFRYNVAQTTAATVALILWYFCLSIGLTFYQRWLLKEFSFPLFVVLCHLVIKLVFSVIIRLGYRICTGKSRILVDWRTFVQMVSPTGLSSGIDIAFSNWGLELVTISLYTMTKSTTIIFILIFAILLGLERRSWSLMTIVILISVGLCLFTYKATDFNGLGFSFLLFASLVSGLRWSFAQLIMQKCKLGLHNPIDMVFHMQPWMILSVLPFMIGFEGHRLYDGWMQLDTGTPETSALVVDMMWKIFAGACIAFCMELSEFLALSFTSSLTLAVSNIFKEICQLILAVQHNGDRLSALNVVGLVMCLGGICSHVLHKYQTMVSQRRGGGVAGGARRLSVSGGAASVGGDGGGGGGKLLNGASARGRGDADGEDGGKMVSNTVGDQSLSWRSTSGGQQSMPLLNGGLDDSDDSGDDLTGRAGRQNSSDIIFDVLKRRDSRRAPIQ